MRGRQLLPIRQNIQMIFQDPMESLNSRHTVGDILEEPFIVQKIGDSASRTKRVSELLDIVGLPARSVSRYPFEFSGGMRQRVVIAMALVCHPQVLICDEPTTALDVTIQAEILTLIRDLQRELGNSVLYITHDLGVVAQLADHVVVMYQGRVLEIGTVRQVLKSPLHPYTQGLLAAIPGLARSGERLATIASVVGDEDITTPYRLIKLSDGRQVSLPMDRIPERYR